MAEINYRAYREYVDSRVEVNNAMMALLAGSRLAAHTLQLTAGSTRTLAEVFPAVEHIGRFNLRSDSTRELLHDADQHVSSVAVPYALATHEDFVTATLEFLSDRGRTLDTQGKQIKPWNMHEVLFRTTGYSPPTDWLGLFHVLRETRNCIIHSGGAADSKLDEVIASMSDEARAGWRRLCEGAEPESIIERGRLRLSASHVFMAFAVTKGLGREVNASLAAELTRDEWAGLAVDDYALQAGGPRNSSAWRRGVLGFARFNYGPALLGPGEIEKAARAGGHWTASSWK